MLKIYLERVSKIASFSLKSLMITRALRTKLITVRILPKIVKKVPYPGRIISCTKSIAARKIVEERKAIESFFDLFHSLTQEKITKRIVKVPDRKMRSSGMREPPFRSSAEDITERMCIPIPQKASVLFLIFH